MRAKASIGAVAAALAFLAAGCGGSDADGVPPEEWAGALCTSIGAWTGALTDATNRLRSPERLTINGFKGAIASVVDATHEFVDDIGELGVPATTAGEQTERELQRLGDTLEAGADALSDELAQADDGLPGLLARLSAITGTLSDLGGAVGTTFDRLSNLEGAEELEDAFAQAEECGKLGPTR